MLLNAHSASLKEEIKDQLPYIGKEINGRIQWRNGHILKGGRRPDYISFKSKTYQTLWTCIDMIMGLFDTKRLYAIVEKQRQSAIVKIADKVMNKYSENIYKEIKTVSHKEAESLYDAIEMILDPVDKEALAIHRNIYDILELISLGVAEKKIPFTKANDLLVVNQIKSSPTVSDVYLDGLASLKWVKQHSFPIPKELPFAEKEDGSLCWIETDKKLKPKYWVEQAILFCQKEKEKNGQLPKKEEVLSYIKAQTEKENVVLGKHSHLPDAVFEKEIWAKLPPENKRKIGEKTI